MSGRRVSVKSKRKASPFRVAVELPEPMVDALAALAEADGNRSIASLVRAWIVHRLKEHGARDGA
jgi:hypothetical protein